MNIRLVHQIPPAENNPRNSEGAFIRGKNGEILFAYSRYTGISNHDHASCDIALTVSRDEGESWSEPRIIAPAAFFGTKNVMSVSALRQNNGDIGFYFLIKENNYSTTVGRAISADGENFRCERCRADFEEAYYVINNDRFVRLKNGRIIVPAAYVLSEENRISTETSERFPFRTTLLYSDDDGKSFQRVSWEYTIENRETDRGLQEPGVIEREDGSLFMWMRTGVGCQFESVSNGDIDEFSSPMHGRFTSPPSPMQMKFMSGAYYVIYNPIPNYNGRENVSKTWGRTPFVMRKSKDCETFGVLNIIEDDKARGYCYPAMLECNDGNMLIAYCRGNAEDGNTLCRLGIAKIDISTVE